MTKHTTTRDANIDDIEASFQRWRRNNACPSNMINLARGAHSAGWWDGQQALTAKMPEGWSLTEILDSPVEGIVLRGPRISYCVWKDEDAAFYLFLESILKA